jgi:hypothetical protein
MVETTLAPIIEPHHPAIFPPGREPYTTKRVAELVPAFATELRHECGHPGPVCDPRPTGGGRSDQRTRRPVHDADGGVGDDHAAQGDARHEEKAGGKAEGLKDGVALDAVRSWSDELHDVIMCSIERSDLDEVLKEWP